MKRKVWLYIGIGVIIILLASIVPNMNDGSETSSVNVVATQASDSGTQPKQESVVAEAVSEPEIKTEPAQERSSAVNGVPVISAEELYDAFLDNEVAANKKYGGKTYCVEGNISGFMSGVLDDEPIVRIGAGILKNVDCHFSKSQEDEIASLKKGQFVRIIGKVEKSLIGADLEKCKLVK